MEVIFAYFLIFFGNKYTYSFFLKHLKWLCVKEVLHLKGGFVLGFKLLTVVISLLITVSFGAQAATSKVLTAIVAECFSNRNYFENDSCSRIGTNKCTISLSQNAEKISVSIPGLSPISAVIQDHFMSYPTKSGIMARAELNFGGLKRGMVQYSTDTRTKRIVGLDIYFNKDYRGQTYTRYRCGRFY